METDWCSVLVLAPGNSRLLIPDLKHHTAPGKWPRYRLLPGRKTSRRPGVGEGIMSKIMARPNQETSRFALGNYRE